jgi:hypothetical protein
VLERLGVAGIVDEAVWPFQVDIRSRGALTPGFGRAYLALGTLNRVVAQSSKLGFSEWRATTTGDRLLRHDAIDDEQINEIERKVSAAAVATLGLDCRGLVLEIAAPRTQITLRA